MIINNARDERKYREAAEISLGILQELGENIKEGVTTKELDDLAGELCKQNKVKPSFARVPGYDFNSCISINDVVVHGLPDDRPFQKGDLVSIDFGIVYKGLNTDHCWTWSIGEPSKENEKLMKAGKEAVENAVQKAIAGNYTGDLGFEMESTANRYGFNIVDMFAGHGIGKTLHEDPEILAYGEKGTGELLREGMVICVECQVVDDTGEVYIDDNEWSAHTLNGGNSVMYEYMVIVGKEKPFILTDNRDWSTVV